MTVEEEVFARPKNLKDWEKKEKLNPSKDVPHTFDFDEDEEEIWIFNLPKTVNPKKLKGCRVSLEGQKKMEIDGKKYIAQSQSCVTLRTCVFTNEEEKLKIANIETKGMINVRRKV